MKTILDLCGGTGSWSRPYADAGYDVRIVTLPDNDVRTYQPPPAVHGILAAPPCDHFAVSGARWFADKDADGRTVEAIDIVRSCLRIINSCSPAWWALENPVGRIRRLVPELGMPVMAFDPCDYGDPWTKRTLLWGRFTPPLPIFLHDDRSVFPSEGSKMHRIPPRPDRKELRSITPPGFARAFFEVNP